MSPLTTALWDELLSLVRRDPERRAELRRALGLDVQADQLLTVAEAAKVASVDPGSVTRWVRTAGLPATGRGRSRRIRRGDLIAFLERGGRRRVDTATLDPERLAELEERAR